MTPAEFAAMFPGEPFAIRHVERGRTGARSFFWHVQFTNDYWTSDSGRAVYEHVTPGKPDGKGATIEAALDDCARNQLKSARSVSDYRREELAKAEKLVRELEAKVVTR